MYGTSIIEETNEYANSTMKIWYKNENLMAWRDGKAIATAPDLICIINPQNRRGDN